MSNSNWLLIKEQYPIGYKFKGKVFRVRPYGIFIKLDNIENNNNKYLGIINVGHSAWCPEDCKRLPLDYSKCPKENTYLDCMVWYYSDHNK
ncbi:MAG: hypothetical protein ACRC06_00005 [Waterburya sp.]